MYSFSMIGGSADFLAKDFCRTAAFSEGDVAQVPSGLFSEGIEHTDWALRIKEFDTDHQRFEEGSIDSSSPLVF